MVEGEKITGLDDATEVEELRVQIDERMSSQTITESRKKTLRVSIGATPITGNSEPGVEKIA